MWRILRPDAVRVWNLEEVRDSLRWYHMVMRGERPAKYLICKKVALEIDKPLTSLSEDALWKLHREASSNFKALWRKTREGEVSLEELSDPKVSYLDLKVELAFRMLRKCEFCERKCGVDRLKGEKGFCKLDSNSRVASYFLHMGEEAPLVPSGTIFFTSCNSSCVFCQNWDISQDPLSGVEVSPEELANIMEYLRREGAKNINFVGGDPTPHLHNIVKALKYTDVNVPLLWNSNFYMSLKACELLIDLMDIALPDLKWGNDRCALRLSKLPNYFKVVTRNIKLFYDSEVETIIRHLVLPSHLNCCTRPVLKWIAENCPKALVNVMDQWHPDYLVARYPEKYPDISRYLTEDEIKEAYEEAERLKLRWRAVS
ncbi:MAG: pyruvate formate lyase-activating protein [Thermofilum sp. ex4484_15]|nr:MAG: pyruvate formate lyase-activating protein [Thermofilum sp. ex4484_15]